MKTKEKKEKRNKLDTHEQELLKIYEKKKTGKRKFRDDLDGDKREQVKQSDKIRKKQMRNNLDNKIRELKNVDNKKKKEKRDNLDTHEKELLNIYEKKEKESCVITLMMIKENK